MDMDMDMDMGMDMDMDMGLTSPTYPLYIPFFRYL